MQKVSSFSRTGQSTNSIALKRWLLLEQVDTSVVEKRKVFMIGCWKLMLYANESCDEHAVYVGPWVKWCAIFIRFLISGNDVISPESRPLICVYLYMCTQSIQKQIVEFDI